MTTPRKLITFQLGEQVIGVDIMAVREIRTWTPATALPNAPSYIGGIVNLRGVALPVLDLRMRLGWGTTAPGERHVIIVVQIGDQMQGLIVDAVNDIASVPADTMQPVPPLGDASGSEFLDGLAQIDGKLVLILALERLSGLVEVKAAA